MALVNHRKISYREKSQPENDYESVLWVNSRNKRRPSSRAAFLRSGEVPSLCAGAEQKHFFPAVEFLPSAKKQKKMAKKYTEKGKDEKLAG